MMKILCSLVVVSLLACTLKAEDAPLLKDDFTVAKFGQRHAARGEWKIAGGTATCTQEDELYKKNKDHGPIIFYEVGYSDATIRFSYKADAAVKSFVFTCNGEGGHVFRFVTTPTGTGFRAFPPSENDHAVIVLGQEKSLPLKPGEWVPVVVSLRGNKAKVKIGDFEKTFENAQITRAKVNFSVGFSYGTLSIKDVMAEK